MNPGDTATWVGSIATTVAVAFAGWQVLMFRRDQTAQVQAELDGVAVSWHPTFKPHKPEEDGWATWTFEITAFNPGRLPIRNVEIYLDFPCDFRRVRDDGHVDEPSQQLNVGVPVLVGTAPKTWVRKLRLPFNGASNRDVRARIDFTDKDGNRRTNHWSSR